MEFYSIYYVNHPPSKYRFVPKDQSPGRLKIFFEIHIPSRGMMWVEGID
jgi:hypothetical protein